MTATLEPTQAIDMDALLDIARELDENDDSIRPAVLCNIVRAM